MTRKSLAFATAAAALLAAKQAFIAIPPPGFGRGGRGAPAAGRGAAPARGN
jgi:hypothetical protein